MLMEMQEPVDMCRCSMQRMGFLQRKIRGWEKELFS